LDVGAKDPLTLKGGEVAEALKGANVTYGGIKQDPKTGQPDNVERANAFKGSDGKLQMTVYYKTMHRFDTDKQQYDTNVRDERTMQITTVHEAFHFFDGDTPVARDQLPHRDEYNRAASELLGPG
jgi:hypothetical protein